MNPSDWISRTEISIDGRTYTSVEEMPAAVRARYEQAMRAIDRDGSGIPDVLEGAPPDPNVITSVSTHERIIVNGREYRSWSEVPPALRRAMTSGKSELWINGNQSRGSLLVLLVGAALVGALVMWVLLR